MQKVSEKSLAVVKEKVAVMAKAAGLKKTPDVKISKNEPIACAGYFPRNVQVGQSWLLSWERGLIDEEDVDATLAHEIGHLMDFAKGIRAVFVKSGLIIASYLFIIVLLFASIDASQVFSETAWVPYVFVFILWLSFAPWITRSRGLATQLEADRYACQLIGRQKMAQVFSKRMERNLTNPKNQRNFTGILSTFYYFMTGAPSFSERLENANFQVKSVAIAINEKEDSVAN